MTIGSSAIPLASIIVQSEHSYSSIDEQRDVFESHRHHIFSVAYYMTGDEREAEVILSSTFVQAFRQQARPAVETLDETLMGELRCRLSLDAVPPAQAGEEGLSDRNIRRTDLEEALWQLPARERLCYLLRDVEGYASARVAALLEISEAEAQRTTLSARFRLRTLLAALHSNPA